MHGYVIEFCEKDFLLLRNLITANPPGGLKLDLFYQKYVDANGIHIIAMRWLPLTTCAEENV